MCRFTPPHRPPLFPIPTVGLGVLHRRQQLRLQFRIVWQYVGTDQGFCEILVACHRRNVIDSSLVASILILMPLFANTLIIAGSASLSLTFPIEVDYRSLAVADGGERFSATMS
ncbi:hypothetical protein E3N88_16489 [Mikania micrantha]|uniref:Uncharacterized protein n=1 Tax=Mikania micrantha TaxID=192012 RepID=A0A5N6NYK8_9ASTR|nr:hypothetical protein E3N88_16489 [Mikania micrantha]